MACDAIFSDVRRRRQRLRGVARGARRRLAVGSRVVGGIAVHVARGQHLLHAAHHSRRPRGSRDVVRDLQIHGALQPAGVQLDVHPVPHRQQPNGLRVSVHRHRPGGQLHVLLRPERSVSGLAVQKAAANETAVVRPVVFHGREPARYGVDADLVVLSGTEVRLVQTVQLHSTQGVQMLRKLRGLFGLSVSVHHTSFYIFLRKTIPGTGLQEQSFLL